MNLGALVKHFGSDWSLLNSSIIQKHNVMLANKLANTTGSIKLTVFFVCFESFSHLASGFIVFCVDKLQQLTPTQSRWRPKEI